MKTKTNKQLEGIPMGVSQWKAHGKKYGYDKYFQKALIKEIVGKVKKIDWEIEDKWLKKIKEATRQEILKILKQYE